MLGHLPRGVIFLPLIREGSVLFRVFISRLLIIFLNHSCKSFVQETVIFQLRSALGRHLSVLLRHSVSSEWWSSQRIPWLISLSGTWEMQILRPHSRVTELESGSSDVCFNKASMLFWCVLKFEHHWYSVSYKENIWLCFFQGIVLIAVLDPFQIRILSLLRFSHDTLNITFYVNAYHSFPF